PRRAAPDLADPDRARDDRQGPVRAAARRRDTGVRLRRRADQGTVARAGGREEAQAGTEDAAVPDPGCDHAAAAARALQGLVADAGPQPACRDFTGLNLGSYFLLI